MSGSDVCIPCGVVFGSPCPVRGEYLPGAMVAWCYVAASGQGEQGLCQNCWNFSQQNLSWFDKKATLRQAANDDESWTKTVYRPNQQIWVNKKQNKAGELHAKGHGLNSARITVKMDPAFKDTLELHRPQNK